MPIYADAFKRSEDPSAFLAIARELHDLPDADWTPWEEWEFLPSMLRKPKGYIFSEKERRKLAQLCWCSEEIYGHDGVTVEVMIATCARYAADLGSDEEWIVGLVDRRAMFVRRRQLRSLVGLYRFCGMNIAGVDRSFDRWDDIDGQPEPQQVIRHSNAA
ncbi:hypothetical protein ACVWZM_001556 [Bradyrhizobium sp. USDA 4501]